MGSELNMKRIWIDGYEANIPQRLGSGQVAYELLKNLEKLDKKNKYTILLSSAPLVDMPLEREGWNYKILKPNRLRTQIAIPFALYTSKQKPDFIYSPTHYIPRFSPVKRVVTIFDLAYLHFPDLFNKGDLWKLINWTKFSILNADHIITISQFSKKDIIKQYKIKSDKITVAYPGLDPDIFHKITNDEKINNVTKKYNIHKNYILYIGTLQPRKNLIRLIEAFRKIEGMELVIVGKGSGEGRSGWMYEDILKKPKELGIEEKVIFTGFVPKDDLPYLLSGATSFVLPSLWEGFGIPLLEAMACGTPVISSNVSSLPEVVGKAGLLVNPQSADQIEQAIRVVSFDKKLRRDLIKKGFEQAKKFSWKKMAQEVLKVFETEIV